MFFNTKINYEINKIVKNSTRSCTYVSGSEKNIHQQKTTRKTAGRPFLKSAGADFKGSFLLRNVFFAAADVCTAAFMSFFTNLKSF